MAPMELLFFLLVLVAAPLIALAGVVGLVVFVIRIWQGPSSHGSRHNRAEETKLIQEIHQGLSEMEKRVEALETILLDAQRRKDHESRP
jgi:phage shock protein B